MSPMKEIPYTDAEFDEAVARAYGYNDYVDEDGDPDNGPLADKIAMKVRKARAKNTLERAAVAYRAERLMGEVFSNVLGPDKYGEAENPKLAEDLYDYLLARVWSLCRMDPNGAVQQRLEGLNGEDAGLILCQTRVSSRALNAVYTTTDWGCLEADLDSKYRRQNHNSGRRYGAAMDMVMRRNPHLRKKAQKSFELGMQLALNAGRAEFAAALEAADDIPETTEADDE